MVWSELYSDIQTQAEMTWERQAINHEHQSIEGISKRPESVC